MQKQDIVGYRTPLDAARRYKLEKVKVLKVAEDGSVAEVMLKGDAKDGSKITLKADQIDLKGKNINLTGDDISISSTNFNVTPAGVLSCTGATISGTVTSSNGIIGSWSINNNGIYNANGFYINNYTTTIDSKTYNCGVSNIYTMSDIIVCRLIITGVISVSSDTPEFEHYDVNGDGVINTTDLLIIRNIVNQL